MASLKPWAQSLVDRRLGLIVLFAWFVLLIPTIFIWLGQRFMEELALDIRRECRELFQIVFGKQKESRNG